MPRVAISRRSLIAGAIPLAFAGKGPGSGAEWKAGAASVKVTPTKSLWMAGYAARTKPSEGILQDLFVKALALKEERGAAAVLVTSDLLGFPRAVSDRIARRVQARFGIPRDRLILNSSHTHGGPVIGDALRIAYQDMNASQWADVAAYTQQLEDAVVDCVGRTVVNLQPAKLSFGHTEVGFSRNRRLDILPVGPIDHDVPVLKVESESGALLCIVFGYACHNTTLVGNFYRFHGDYAGFAQELIERKSPGTVAMFVAGCGGDQGPNPRGEIEHVHRYGEELGTAVLEAMHGRMVPLHGPLKSRFAEARVEFASPPTRQSLLEKRYDSNTYIAKHAELMLQILDNEGKLPEDYRYPVQVWRFGTGLTFIALAGEVVVDYAHRLKRELGPENLWVAGYCNDVFAYIPSRRVLREGGYEGGGAMIYYGQPGPFAQNVEETIIGKIHDLVRRVQ